MKKNSKRLSLQRQAIREIAGVNLHAAAGGGWIRVPMPNTKVECVWSGCCYPPPAEEY
jgi:hypothetical protein